MDSELAHLESQAEQLIGLYEAGRSELRELRGRLAEAEALNRELAGKVVVAAQQLESLLARLPED